MLAKLDQHKTMWSGLIHSYLSSAEMKLTLFLSLFIDVMKWRFLIATNADCINPICEANIHMLGFRIVGELIYIYDEIILLS